MSIFVVFPSCSREKFPFTYTYTSRDTVIIDYLGQNYTLKQGAHVDIPFTYRFEPDGDVNISIDGKEYEIDSPYDEDRNKKKKAKSKKKKSKKR